MATLPNPDQFNRVGAQPSTTIVSGRAGVAEGMQAERFQNQSKQAMETGRAVAQLGKEFADIAYEQRRKLDKLNVQDRYNKLRDATVEMKIGEKGYSKTQLGDVLKPDFIKSNVDNFDSKVKELAETLTNEDQKREFSQHANEVRSAHMRGIMEHSFNETEKYDKVVYDGTVASITNSTLAQYDDQAAVTGGEVALSNTVRARLKQQGIVDEAMLAEAERSTVGSLHAGIVDTARRNGRIQYANDYFNAKKDSMTAEQRASVEQKLLADTELDQGNSIGSAAFDIVASGGKESEANTFIRDNAKTHGTAQAAKAAFAAAKQAAKQDNDNTIGSLVMTARDSGMTFDAVRAVRGTEEFKNLSTEDQNRLHEHLLSLAEHQETRGETEQARKNTAKWKSPEAYKQYGFVASEGNLAKMDEAAIYAMEPDIGPQRVDALIRERAQVLKDGFTFKIDRDLIEERMPKELTAPKNKDKKYTYLGIVESNLADWKAAHPGERPTLDDQKKMIRGALNTYSERGFLWGTNQKPLYESDKNMVEYRRRESNFKAMFNEQVGRDPTPEELARAANRNFQ